MNDVKQTHGIGWMIDFRYTYIRYENKFKTINHDGLKLLLASMNLSIIVDSNPSIHKSANENQAIY
jgi:uncharacterized membrane protein